MNFFLFAHWFQVFFWLCCTQRHGSFYFLSFFVSKLQWSTLNPSPPLHTCLRLPPPQHEDSPQRSLIYLDHPRGHKELFFFSLAWCFIDEKQKETNISFSLWDWCGFFISFFWFGFWLFYFLGGGAEELGRLCGQVLVSGALGLTNSGDFGPARQMEKLDWRESSRGGLGE